MPPTDAMAWLLRRGRAFWFAPRPCFDLAVCRVLFYGGLLALFGGQELSALCELPSRFWQPVSFFHWLPQPSAQGIRFAQIGWNIALACAALGLATRLATLAALAGGVYLLGLLNTFGTVRLDHALLVLALAVMAGARSGECLSLDRWLRRRPDPAPSGEFTWPIRLVWVLMALMYCGSGFAKLRMSGLDWITSDYLGRTLVAFHYGVDPPPVTDWGLAIAASPWLCGAMAASSLALELAFPLCLVARRLRWVLLPATYLMHVALRLVMGPNFLPFALVYLFWIPWRRILRR